MSTSPSKQLVEYLCALDYDDLAPEVVLSARAAVLDHLACALYGIDQPWVTALRDAVGRSSGPVSHGSTSSGSTPGDAAVLGTHDRLSPTDAALINGTAAHGFELDDIYWRMHPGSVVIPAALACLPNDSILANPSAVARKFILAVVIGYELMGRVGNSIGVGHSDDGFHTTGIVGPFGSAIAAARAQGMDAAVAYSAVGIAASLGSGIKAYTHGPGMVKRLHAGQAARNGVFAAILASSGFAGPESALEGRYGFCQVFSDGSFSPSMLTDGLGAEFAIADAYMKPYPCCGAIHGAIRGIEELNSAHDIGLDTIERIEVGTTSHGLQKSQPHPVDIMTTQYSFESAVALALLGRGRDPTAFTPEYFDKYRQAGTLRDLVRVGVDEEANANFPKSADSRVTITLRDGQLLSVYGVGHGGYNLSPAERWDAATQKFGYLGEKRIDATRQSEVLAAVDGLGAGADSTDPRAIAELLT